MEIIIFSQIFSNSGLYSEYAFFHFFYRNGYFLTLSLQLPESIVKVLICFREKESYILKSLDKLKHLSLTSFFSGGKL